MRDRLLLLLAPPLSLVAPIISAMLTQGQAVVSAGALLFLGGIAAIGLLIGIAAAVTVGRPGWSIIPVAALTINALILIDVMGGGIGSYAETTLGKGAYAVALGMAIFGALWIIRRKMASIAFAAAAALFASAFFVPAAQAREDPGPLIYIVMDEMIGMEGIDRSLPGGGEAYDAVRSIFERHGFRIYGQAFSRHYFSARSIPAILNFDDKDDGPVSRYRGSGETRLQLFNELLEDGKGLVVYQTAHMDFCAPSRRIDCRTFPSFDASEWIEENGGSVFLHAAAVGNVMIRAFVNSSFVNRYVGLFNAIGGGAEIPLNFDVHGFPQWFDSFEDEVIRGTSDAYFAHFLFPHAPLIFNDECEIQERYGIPSYYLQEVSDLSGQELDEARAKAYAWYFEQLRCAAKKLDHLFASLAATPGLAYATIVVLGDHGSRISAGKNSENLSDRDMIDNFSTFYAIKGPGIAPGYNLRKASVQRLTAEYFSGKTAEELGPESLTVVVDSVESGRVVLREMPDFANIDP